jgi:hypothetical protein
MARLTFSSLAALALAALPFTAHAQSSSPTKQLPPKTWVDKDTGHRVWRISDEPNSGAFYFNPPPLPHRNDATIFSVLSETFAGCPRSRF